TRLVRGLLWLDQWIRNGRLLRRDDPEYRGARFHGQCRLGWGDHAGLRPCERGRRDAPESRCPPERMLGTATELNPVFLMIGVWRVCHTGEMKWGMCERDPKRRV